MTMTDTAAHASIGAAARELHLPTIRAEATRLVLQRQFVTSSVVVAGAGSCLAGSSPV
jgi:hypothetical protein